MAHLPVDLFLGKQRIKIDSNSRRMKAMSGINIARLERKLGGL